MARQTGRVLLPGSERKALAGAKRGRVADLNDLIEVTIRVRGSEHQADSVDKLLKLGGQLPGKRKYLSREEYASKHGADPADLAKVDAFAHEHGLTVVRTSLAQRTVKLAGTIADFNAAFGVKLRTFKSRGLSYRGRTGSIYIPKELKGIITGVHGLDNRPVARPHFRLLSRPTRANAPRNAPDGTLAVTDVTKLYSFPAGLTGKGQCIALIELNDVDEKTGKITGVGYSTSDLKAFFENARTFCEKLTANGNLPAD